MTMATLFSPLSFYRYFVAIGNILSKCSLLKSLLSIPPFEILQSVRNFSLPPSPPLISFALFSLYFMSCLVQLIMSF